MARRYETDTMTGSAFKQALRDLDIDMYAFCHLTLVNPRTVQRWLKEEQDIPHIACLALELLKLPKALGTARMLSARMIRLDNKHPELGEYPYAAGREFPAEWAD